MESAIQNWHQIYWWEMKSTNDFFTVLKKMDEDQ